MLIRVLLNSLFYFWHSITAIEDIRPLPEHDSFLFQDNLILLTAIVLHNIRHDALISIGHDGDDDVEEDYRQQQRRKHKESIVEDGRAIIQHFIGELTVDYLVRAYDDEPANFCDLLENVHLTHFGNKFVQLFFGRIGFSVVLCFIEVGVFKFFDF